MRTKSVAFVAAGALALALSVGLAAQGGQQSAQVQKELQMAMDNMPK